MGYDQRRKSTYTAPVPPSVGRAVQKQSTARNGQTIIALVNGEATIKTYYRKSGAVELHPANDTLKPIVVRETDAFHIEGIVVGVIRHLGR